MKKSIKERFKKTGRRITKRYSPSAWAGYDQLESTASQLKKTVANIFVPPLPGIAENFVDVAERMGLTPEALQKKQKALWRLSVFLVLLTLLVATYAVYHLLEAHFRAFFPSIVLSLVCLSFAFHYHFWYFQIKVGHLGCTFHQWWSYMLSGKKP